VVTPRSLASYEDERRTYVGIIGRPLVGINGLTARMNRLVFKMTDDVCRSPSLTQDTEGVRYGWGGGGGGMEITVNNVEPH
jgi:hypothetical protein